MDHAHTAEPMVDDVAPVPAPAAAPAARASLPTDLDRVREILFGAQLRETDTRFSALEARLAEGIATLDREMTARQNDFDSQVRACFDELRRRIAADNQRFSEQLASLSDEVRQVDWRLQEHGAMLRNRMDVIRGDLQQAMAGSLGTLESQLSSSHDDLNSRLSSRLEALEQASVERRTLADALDSIARELRTAAPREQA